jgi:YNFM family putative membrane transporter
MGSYVTALIAGGLIGRIVPALIATALGWRWAIGLLAVLPLAAAVVMTRTLIDLPPLTVEGGRWSGVRRQLRNRRLLRTAAAGAAYYFTFVGTFSYVVFRLERPPFSFGPAAGSAVFALWLLGICGPVFGALADRLGWRRLAFAAFAVAAVGLAVSLSSQLPLLVLGLAFVTLANWAGVTAAQIGVAQASDVDRGTASALYFSLYYLTGAVGGYLPGVAWERWGWQGVVTTGWIALGLASAVLASDNRLWLPSRQ